MSSTDPTLDSEFEAAIRAFESKFRLVKTLKEHGWRRVHGSRFGDRAMVTAFINPSASKAMAAFWGSMNDMTDGCEWLVWVIRPSIWPSVSPDGGWACQAKFYTGQSVGPDEVKA